MMALIADGPADRLEQMLRLSERLIELVKAETTALKQGNPTQGRTESEEFTRLSNVYRAEMGRIRDNPALIAGAPLRLREAMQRATAGLQAELDHYGAVLNAAKTVTEGLLQAIAEEVNRTVAVQQSYGAQGGYAAAGPTPLAVDRRA